MLASQSHLLLVHGLVLFLLGLITGLAIPAFKNPRMGLSAHLAGVQNGMVLLLFGFLWHRVELSEGLQTACFWMSVYSMEVIWLAVLLAALWGSSKATPIAGAGYEATPVKEGVVLLLLSTGALAILAATVLLLWGLIQAGSVASPQ